MSRISHFAASIIIQLLTAAIKFRKAGLISLLAFSLINCYFMLFNQQAYIAFLEHYISPDGHISDINYVFFRVQTPTILMTFFWFLIDQPSIDLIKEKALLDDSNLPWRQRPLPYIIICCVWLLISYTPFLFLDSKTIINSIQEDGFFQIFGALSLFISSMLFFYLHHLEKKHRGKNIWFILLGLLFFIGAGEEINWGQQTFHFATPDFLSSNVQHAFSLHNLPLLDGRAEAPSFDEHGIKVVKFNTGFIKTHLTAAYLFLYFCIFSLLILPILYLLNTKMRSMLHSIKMPITSICFGIIYLIELKIDEHLQQHFATLNSHSLLIEDWVSAITYHKLVWASVEIHETFDSFLFVMVALWLIQNLSKNHRKD